MDNRWRFLYCGMTELWGHVRKAEAGDGLSRCKRGTSHFGKSGWQWEAVMRSEIQVAKSVSHASRKAAIVYTVPVP